MSKDLEEIIMEIILSLVLCILLVIIFFFIGLVINKFTNIAEDVNKLLKFLICFSFGASIFLIISNLFGNVTKNFNTTLMLMGLLISGLIIWQIKDFKELCNSLKYFFQIDNLKNWLHERTNKYFWCFLLITNIIYLLIALSSTKIGHYGVGSSYISRIDQLISGDYPPVDYCRQNLNMVFSFGSEILAGLISIFPKSSPEISLDILTILFLNLNFLCLYSLSLKFLSGKIPLAKYIVPITAFFAWGPITQLFTPKTGEMTGLNLPEKVNFLTQSKLINIAEPTGLFIHWFFLPSISLGIFFLIISLYLIFMLFEGKRNLNYSILLGLFLSTFFIIDLSLFLVLLFGIIIYLIFSSIPETDKYKIDNKNELYKYLGITFLVAIIFGFINTNLFQIITTKGFFDINSSYLNEKYGPLASNTLLFAAYCYGFYHAFKNQEKWVAFLAYFFLGSLIAPLFLNIPGTSSGKIIMSGNFLAAFSMPLVIDFVIKKFNFKSMEIKAFYVLAALIFCSNSLMFFAFGDKEKPVFKIVNKKIQYGGLQVIPKDTVQDTSSALSEESPFINVLRAKKSTGQNILSERQFSELFASKARVCHLLPSDYPPNTENALEKGLYTKAESEYCEAFSFDSKYLQDKKINWIYLTPKLFKYHLSPQSRIKLLNTYLNKGLTLEESNERADAITYLKELYHVDPKFLAQEPSENFPSLLNGFINEKNKKKKNPLYIKNIANCPYLGIYNVSSKDFDGDKIADLAFFDSSGKKWIIIYGKTNKEDVIDLNKNLLANHKSSDLLIPVPSDWDGDSKTDIALFNRTTGEWYILRSSDQTVKTDIKWGGYYGEIPLAGDLNGDLKSDFSAYGSNNSNWPTLLSKTNGYYDNGFGSSLIDISLYADIDADKKSDYVIYRVEEGAFYVYLSSRSYDKDNFIKVTMGKPKSVVVLEDYDGDGKSDLGTWEPETGIWEFAYAKNLLTSNNSGANHKISFGSAGSVPLPGDYDGDGKAEIAIYNSKTSELEILNADGSVKKQDLSKYKKYTLACILGV